MSTVNAFPLQQIKVYVEKLLTKHIHLPWLGEQMERWLEVYRARQCYSLANLYDSKNDMK